MITYYKQTFGKKGGRCIYCNTKTKGVVTTRIHEAKVRCCQKHQSQALLFLSALLLGENIYKAEKVMNKKF